MRQRLLIADAQHIEVVDHGIGLRSAAGMLFNGRNQVVGAAVAQEVGVKEVGQIEIFIVVAAVL